MQTRGERNNNPGNIERNNIHWQGIAADQSGDTRFVMFDKPENGIRALAKILLNYQRLHQLETMAEIIDKWAPAGENDTSSYVNAVCADMGVQADAEIDLRQAPALAAATKAIIKHENGRVIYSDELIAGAVDAALAT